MFFRSTVDQAITIFIPIRSAAFQLQILTSTDATILAPYFQEAAEWLSRLSTYTAIGAYRSCEDAWTVSAERSANRDYIAEITVPRNAIDSGTHLLLKQNTKITPMHIKKLYPNIVIARFDPQFQQAILHAQRNGISNLADSTTWSPQPSQFALSDMISEKPDSPAINLSKPADATQEKNPDSQQQSNEKKTYYLYARSQPFDIAKYMHACCLDDSYLNDAIEYMNTLSKLTMQPIFESYQAAINANLTLQGNQDCLVEIELPISAVNKLGEFFMLKQHIQIEAQAIAKIYPVIFITSYEEKYRKVLMHLQRAGMENSLRDRRVNKPGM